MKAAILTMFNGLSGTYSLVNVVESHVTMLLQHGVEVRILVSEDCPDSDRYGIFLDSRLEWVKITNQLNGERIHWRDYTETTGELHDSFEAEAEAISRDLVRFLEDVDVCMMHDILYQGWHYIHNVAVRKAQASLPGLRFFAFTHSLPANRPRLMDEKLSSRFSPMNNTIFIYPTHCGIPALARQYGVPEGMCRTIYHVNPIFEFLSEDVRRLQEKTDLLQPDILIIYPARLTRAKQLEKIVTLGGCIQTFCEKSVKVIFCDFASMDTESRTYKEEVRQTGIQYGLHPEDMVFTSDCGYKNGFPRKAVLDLLTLSNLFICTSYSESFGLTVLEAAGRGNFIVLNEAVPALEELGKTMGAYFMRWNARNFGFDTAEQYFPSELNYHREHGEHIVNRMRENPVIQAKTMARTRYSSEWIWENQMRPLLMTSVSG